MTRKAPKMTIEEFQSLLPSTYISSLWDYEGEFAHVRHDWESVYFGDKTIIDDSPHLYRNVGFHTLDTGLTFLGLQCSGGGEFPVFAIIYHDGKDLRGYVPQRGNAYCRKTNMSYGSREEDIHQTSTESDQDIMSMIDHDGMLDDIRANITVTDEPVPTPRYPKPVCISAEDFHQMLSSRDFISTLAGEELPEDIKGNINGEPFTHLVIHDWGWAAILYWDGEMIVDRPIPKSIPNTPSTYHGVARSGLGGCPTKDDINSTILEIGGMA